MAKKPSHALVIDGDWLVFMSMSAAEQETDWGDDVWSVTCDHALAKSILLNTIKGIVERRKEWKDSKIVLAFTDSVNWRKDVLPTYKSNRKGTRKPVGYKAFVDSVMASEEWLSFLRPTLEGDDCMGIIGTKPSIVGVDSVTLVSCDKDFKTVPTQFYWLTTGEILDITEEEADYWHMYQTLIGDTTDGYAGVAGVGATTAEPFLMSDEYYLYVSKILKSGKRKGEEEWYWSKTSNEEQGTELTTWERMVTLAAKNGMTEEDMLVQARVARILRSTDYDFKEKKPILWSPT